MSLAPVVENRGAIILASSLGFSPAAAFLWTTAANLAVIPLYYAGLHLTIERLMSVGWLKKYVASRRRRVQPYLDRYGWLGLIIFVSVPLPGTGWYTGGLVAAAIGFRPARAIISLCLGCLGAGILAVLPFVGFHLILY